MNSMTPRTMRATDRFAERGSSRGMFSEMGGASGVIAGVVSSSRPSAGKRIRTSSPQRGHGTEPTGGGTGTGTGALQYGQAIVGMGHSPGRKAQGVAPRGLGKSL